MESFSARFYDGQSNTPKEVRVQTSADGLHIIGDGDRALENWHWPDVYIATKPVSGLRGALGHKTDKAIRLIVPDGVWKAHILPYRKDMPPAISPQTWRFMAIAAAVAALLIVGAPYLADSITPLVPEQWQENIGAATVASIDSASAGGECRPAARAAAAIERLAQSLDDSRKPVHLHIIDDPTVNALSAPGRNLILFTGFLQDAPSQAALAGVLAHEMGHAHYHHPMRSFIRDEGLKFLEVGLTGSTTGLLNSANTLLSLKGSRSFESQADAYSIAAMRRNDYDPNGLVVFLKRLEKLEDVEKYVPTILMSHPGTKDRIAVLQKKIAALPSHPAPYKTPFTKAEWQAIKHACGESHRGKRHKRSPEQERKRPPHARPVPDSRPI
jgi:Zn-dependent protease with chaperone function